MSFDPKMTYRQSLKIVASGLCNSPFRRDDCNDIASAAKDLALSFWPPIIRIVFILTFPISVPLLTLLVQADIRKTTRETQAAKDSIAEQRNKLRDKSWP